MYENKESLFLTKSEALWACWSLLILIFAESACQFQDYLNLDSGFINNEEDIIALHETITSKKGVLLFFSCLWLCLLPIILSHIYCMKRLFETIFFIANIAILKWIYIFSMLFLAITQFVIAPSLHILISYYDWELYDSSNQINITGYYLQYQFILLSKMLLETSVFIVYIVSAVPWLLIIYLLTVNNKYLKTDDIRNEYFGRLFGTPIIYCGKKPLLIISIILIICTIVSAVLSLVSRFISPDNELFSIGGDLQWFELIPDFIILLYCGLLGLIALRLEYIQFFILELIESPHKIDISKIRGKPQGPRQSYHIQVTPPVKIEK